MNILLIGGTGTLSKAVMNVALQKGYQISVFNRGNHNESLPAEVQILKGDFYKTDTIKSAIAAMSFDVVVDFLSRRPQDIERVFPLFKEICKQYIFISSSCVYRRDDKDMPIRENSPKPNPHWRYNIDKYECEKSLVLLAKREECKYTIVRPYITYDEGRIPFGISPVYKYHRTIIERIKAGKPMFVWNNGQTVTTATHTDDFAVGVVGLFMNEKAYNEDFHITTSTTHKVIDVLNELSLQLGVSPNVVFCKNENIYRILPGAKEMLTGDRALDAIFDNSKILEAVPELCFKVNIEDGIRRNINYYAALDKYLYDYEYDALLDKLVATEGYKTKYIKYPSARGEKLKYLLYRYMPYKIARKLSTYIK